MKTILAVDFKLADSGAVVVLVKDETDRSLRHATKDDLVALGAFWQRTSNPLPVSAPLLPPLRGYEWTSGGVLPCTTPNTYAT
jgi:hypothetical protein